MLKKNTIIYIIIGGVTAIQTKIGYGAFGIEKVNTAIQKTDGKNANITIELKDLIVYLLGFLGLIAVIWGMKGGFQILTAAGDEDRFKTGKETVLYMLLGIFVILIAYALIEGLTQGLATATK